MEDRAQAAFENLVILAALIILASTLVLLVSNIVSIKGALKASGKSYAEKAANMVG